tara:strand:- start:3333 stop:4079 length:747 start_codon:yes stop_codon:yes gene_type:complete
MDKAEKKRFFYAILFPTIFVVIIWVVKLVELQFDISFSSWGIEPRNITGLKGIVFMPFLHGDMNHLFNNSIPLLILGSSLFYFYRPVAFKVVLWSVLMSGLWTWISARESYHIGASGLVYSLFGFLFFSGFIRKHFRLIAISFLVAFLYGSMVWGIFPIDQKVSFEGHFWGMFAGIVLAYVYKDKGLKRKPHVWVDEDERDEDDPDAYWNKPLQGIQRPSDFSSQGQSKPRPDQEVVYHFKPNDKPSA